MDSHLFDIANLTIAAGVGAKIIGENVGAAALFVGSTALIHKVSKELFDTYSKKNEENSNALKAPKITTQTTLFILLGAILCGHKITELFFKRISIDSCMRIGNFISTVLVLNSSSIKLN